MNKKETVMTVEMAKNGSDHNDWNGGDLRMIMNMRKENKRMAVMMMVIMMMMIALLMMVMICPFLQA